MKAYKVFDADLKCRDYQYEIGKTYEIEGKLKLCGNGFHACKELVHCLSHYSPALGNRLCEVELGGEILGIDEEKQCASKITIIRELSFFNSATWGKYYCTNVKAIKSKATNKSEATNCSEATNNSNATSWSKATSFSKATNYSKATNRSKATNLSEATTFSEATNESKATNDSRATNSSKATNCSEATNCSKATNCSEATNCSKATNRSKATNLSEAISHSAATNCSMLIYKCKGVNESILCAGLDHSYYLFNKKVTKERIDEVKAKLAEFEWLPKFLNFEQLKEKYGDDIKMLPIDRLKGLETKEAYAGMPVDMIEYIKSLPEYDEKIFNEIRGMEEQ